MGDRMELKGSFKQVSDLMDVFQLIHVGKKTGRLILSGKYGEITVFIKEGSVINLDVNVSLLKELSDKFRDGKVDLRDFFDSCLHYVSLWDTGNFKFVEEEIPVEEKGSLDVLNAMMEFTKERDEVGSLIEGLIRSDVNFELLDQPVVNEINLTQDEWRILVDLIKNRKSMQEVLFSNVPFGKILSSVGKLIKSGLISPIMRREEREERVKFISGDKLEAVKEFLSDSMGPMGSFLVDDVMDEMGFTKGIPVNMVDSFIDTLAGKIPDDCFYEGERCKDRLKKIAGEILKP